MVLAKELVDKLKKIEDFDITYESSDKDSGEIYIDYNNIVFVLEHYIYEGKFYLSGGLHTITYKGKEYYSDVLPYYLDVDYDSDTYMGDFAFGGSNVWKEIIPRLKGHINLIIGNHDRKNLRQGYMSFFDMVVPQLQIEIEDTSLNHYPFLCYGGSYRGVWQLFGHSGPGADQTFQDSGYYFQPNTMQGQIITILLLSLIEKSRIKQKHRKMKVWIGLKPNDRQGI